MLDRKRKTIVFFVVEGLTWRGWAYQGSRSLVEIVRENTVSGRVFHFVMFPIDKLIYISKLTVEPRRCLSRSACRKLFDSRRRYYGRVLVQLHHVDAHEQQYEMNRLPRELTEECSSFDIVGVFNCSSIYSTLTGCPPVVSFNLGSATLATCRTCSLRFFSSRAPGFQYSYSIHSPSFI